MIYLLLGLGVLFAAIGLIVTENNAKYLLSGYNTMSEEERKSVDIKSYIRYFRKFHLFLGVSLFLLGSAFTYLISEVAGGLFLSTYPILAYLYFVITGRKFWKKASFKGNKAAAVILVGTLVFVVGLMGYGLKEDTLSLESDTFVFKGSYGEKLTHSEIQNIELVDQLPHITLKTNGFGLGSVRKGHFRTIEKEVVKLILNGAQKPLILFTKTDGKKIYYSARSTSNEDIIKEIRQILPDKVVTH